MRKSINGSSVLYFLTLLRSASYAPFHLRLILINFWQFLFSSDCQKFFDIEIDLEEDVFENWLVIFLNVEGSQWNWSSGLDSTNGRSDRQASYLLTSLRSFDPGRLLALSCHVTCRLSD